MKHVISTQLEESQNHCRQSFSVRYRPTTFSRPAGLGWLRKSRQTMKSRLPRGAWLVMALGAMELTAFSAQAAKPVALAVVEKVQHAPVTWYSGTVRSQQEARLSMETTGRLTRLVEFGQTVKQGQVLAEVNADALALELKIAKVAAKRAQAVVSHQETELVRLDKLATRRNISETEQATARHELSISRIALENARLEVDLIEEKLARTRLVAPFDGTVNDVFKSGGEYVNQGEALIHLVNTRLQEIRLQVPIAVTEKLTTGTALKVVAGDQPLTASLNTKSAGADLRSRLIEMRLHPENASLTVGQPVRIAIPGQFAEDSVLVPRDAVISQAGGTALFVASKGDDDKTTVREVPVNVLYSLDGKVAVKGEIGIGKQVVVRGASGLTDGQQVEVMSGS